MKFRIGCVDGHTYESDSFSREEIQAQIDAVGGRIGTGAQSHVTVSTVEEALEFILDFAKYDKSNDTQTFTVTINGRDRTFNSCHIVWWEFDE